MDRTAEQAFWDWFRDHADELYAFEQDQERLFGELSVALRTVARGLCFEIGSVRDSVREFVVSADGMRKLFPAVEQLVTSAPLIPGWTVLAFRPRLGEAFAIQIGKLSLGSDDLWFTARQDVPGEALDLWLHIPGLISQDDKERKQAAYILLDGVIGEYDTEVKIGRIGFRSLPPDPKAAGLRPLKELTAVVDEAFPRSAAH